MASFSPVDRLHHSHSVPVALTLGTALERLDVGEFTVTRSTNAPDERLPRHVHASATVVLQGGLSERVAGRHFELGRDRFLVRPPGEPHENGYGQRGAECVIVGAHPRWVADDAVARSVFDRPGVAAAPAVMPVARRTLRELRVGDDAARLASSSGSLSLDVHRTKVALVAWMQSAMRNVTCAPGP